MQHTDASFLIFFLWNIAWSTSEVSCRPTVWAKNIGLGHLIQGSTPIRKGVAVDQCKHEDCVKVEDRLMTDFCERCVCACMYRSQVMFWPTVCHNRENNTLNIVNANEQVWTGTCFCGYSFLHFRSCDRLQSGSHRMCFRFEKLHKNRKV